MLRDGLAQPVAQPELVADAVLELPEDAAVPAVPPGPALGKLLTELRDKQLQEELTSKEQALAWVREAVASARP